jgi:type IV fimbrial biogenesis protein FimT
MVELMVTLVVLAILLAVAAPNLATFVNNSRLRATQGELVSALTLARSEATKRGMPVVVEALANPTVAGSEFSQGWFVYVDANRDGVFNEDESWVVRRYSPLPGGQRLGAGRGDPRVSVSKVIFNERGFLSVTSRFDFVLCGQAGMAKGYRILLEPVGLADTLEKGDLCS